MGSANSRLGLDKFLETLPPEDDITKLLKEAGQGVILNQPSAVNRGVLSSYTKFMDGPINRALRTGVGAQLVVDYIQAIEEDILRTPLINAYVCYRGLKTQIIPQVGDSIRDKGFMSKSASPAVAFNFIEDVGTLLILYYPEPSHQLFIYPYSRYPDEYELLSLPGESFVVNKVLFGSQVNVVYAMFESQEEPIVQVDPRIDQGFRNLEPTIQFLRFELTQNKFIGVKTKETLDFIYIDGNPGVPLDDEGNIRSDVSWTILEKEIPAELERRIIAAWYSEILEGLYILDVPEYQRRSFRIERGREGFEDYEEYHQDPNWTLKTDERGDDFRLAYAMIMGNLVNVDLPLPSLEQIWP